MKAKLKGVTKSGSQAPAKKTLLGGSWLRMMRLFTILGVVVMVSSCNDDDSDMDIEPDGPRPEWGPTISDEMLAVIEALDSLQTGPPLYERTAEEARMAPTAADAAMAVMENNNIPVPPSQVDTAGMEIAVDGGMIHLRTYTPRNATGPFPGIVYYHGGGWVIAGIDTYDASARALAEKTGAVVVAVAYRQAPEYKFPTAHEDSFTAYEWVVNNAASINVDLDRIAVAGESAGGNLAAAVSMMARDRNVQMPVHQLLVYPIAGYDFNTPSYEMYAEAKPLNRPLMMWFFDKYLRTEADAESPWISLVDAPNLENLPPATVINAQIDPLQSEGQAYADRLEEAGVPVTARVYEGVTHEFFGMAAVVPAAEEAQNLAAEELREAFEQ
ncbi:alpha/beta hydrolase [Pontibacter silvestris]|uniref:Alpha/beta hydrolase n=1 Tax=Pontibacter silvestris TaxID=2305183 RepID=A0ABW4X3K7_9BACT|nr:alpha/beta hydrolase [Pontibacter silvestris]MCC9134855.1 alpha/beta hydrolase [Pontibacter silvestris]